MRVSTADLTVKAFSPDVDRDAFPRIQGSSFPRFCQLWLEQTTTHLAGTCAWLKCSSAGSQPIVLSHFWAEEAFEPWLLNYLETAGWWHDALPIFELSEVAIQGDRFVYVYPFSGSPRNDYVLVSSVAPLPAIAQQWLRNQFELFHQHFLLEQERCQQQEAIQHLEHTIRQAQHQLRNPVALIEIYASMLTAGVPEQEMRSHASQIQEVAQELSTHLQKLNTRRPAPSISHDWHDLRVILADSLKGIQPWLAEKQIMVQHSLAPAIVQVDAWQLKQVFDNLLTNAMHFSPVGAAIHCHWEVYRNELLIEVWDEGPGMSEADLQNLFTPFYSRRPGGTGLGLAIAQKIVSDHQGRLWAKNLPTQGAKFSFTLPRCQKRQP
jgi:signal transduction histidine kinase